jgi:hypothetical protein
MTSSQLHVLPPLSQEEVRHSEALGALIAAEVRAAGGWLSFERYMELAPMRRGWATTAPAASSSARRGTS